MAAYHITNGTRTLALPVYWILQFLSMKLEAVNSRNPGIEVFPSKDVSPQHSNPLVRLLFFLLPIIF